MKQINRCINVTTYSIQLSVIWNNCFSQIILKMLCGMLI